MYEYIRKLTNRFFQNVPYSRTEEEAKESIRQGLTDQYEKLLQEKQSDVKAMGSLLQEFGQLEEAAALTELSQEELRNLQERTPTHDKKQFRKQYLWGKTLSILLACLAAALCVSVLHMCMIRTPWYLVSITIYGVIMLPFVLLYRRVCRQFSYDSVCFGMDAKLLYDIYLDRYKKRHINFTYLALAFLMEYTTVFENILVSKAGRQEGVGMLVAGVTVPAFGVIMFVYSFLMARMLLGASGPVSRQQYAVYVRKIYWQCGVFTACAVLGTICLKCLIYNPFPFLYLATGIFLIVSLLRNFSRRATVVIQNIRKNRCRIACYTLAALLLVTVTYMKRDVYVLQPYITQVSPVEHRHSEIAYDNASGVYTITAPAGDFKILHLTDIHLGGSVFSSFKDYKAYEACRKLIEASQPDFVIVTGDMVFPMGIMSFSLNNKAPVMQFAAFMRNIGIPWAFTFGNHDTESMASADVHEITDLYESLSYKSSGTLLYPYVQPDISGRSNQMIRLENQDGSVRQALFLIDSNDYTAGSVTDYDCIHEDQVAWYREQVEKLIAEQGSVVPSMLFFHIPLQEYRTAFELYEAGDDQVTYYFGEIGETMYDRICCSDYPCSLFDTAVDLGSTKAMFCGHDHYNNISMEYRGIRLTYGMSIDYLAMPGIANRTKQRGGELITIHADSTFDIRQIPLTEIER